MARSLIFIGLCLYTVTGSQLRADPKKAKAEPEKKAAGNGTKGGKVENLNDNMPLKAQEQGFTGKKVEHKNGTTGTDDWMKEYGHAKKAFVQADPKKEAAKPAGNKSGGKVENLNDKMPLKAAEQGFTGKKVAHKNGTTATDDWGSEYGHSKKAFMQADPKKAEAKPAANKSGGKPENLNDKMPLKAAEQGFTGKKVEHKNGTTATSDWHSEYGHSKSLLARADPKKAAAKPEEGAAKKDTSEDLSKPMPLKAAEQGFSGKKVQHEDGKTMTGNWTKEYGHAKATPSPKKSGSMRGALSSIVLLTIATLALTQ